MKKKIILVSKDILRPDYLNPYGNGYYKTPNINDLAKKGTIFLKHYTGAPSTAMAFTCMFTGLNVYELDRKDHVKVEKFNQGPTLFDLLESQGYSCHIIWGEKESPFYANCFGNLTKKHYLDFRQSVGPHKLFGNKITNDDKLAENTCSLIINKIDSIVKDEDKIFIWIHLPHVLLGRTCYGGDIDLLDDLIGEIRKRFEDDAIYITADHGHMNCSKGIPCYGFDVYEDAIRIPLITPRISDQEVIDFPTSNTQLKEIILKQKITRKEYIFSDCAYYMQYTRKLAIIKDNYKYIYNKFTKTEELYDLDWDKNEEINLLKDTIYDTDRNMKYNINQIYYYPFYDLANNYFKSFQQKRIEIWREGPRYMDYYSFFIRKLKNIKVLIKLYSK